MSQWVLFKNEFIPVAPWYQSIIIRNESFLNEFIEFSFRKETLIQDDLLYLYKVNVVRHSYVYESSLGVREA